ncbi:MAG: response regulator [Bacteroidia bacterium]
MKHILLCDDHSLVRNAIKFILLEEFKEIEFGEANNTSEIFHKIKEKKWDILILDENMPCRNGLEILKKIKDEKTNIPVLIFSLYAEDLVAVRILRSGAAGYLSKNTVDTELIKAVHQILKGKKYISPTVAELIAGQLENPHGKAPHEFLSDREYQTLLLISSGKNVSQIAEELVLSVATISTYRARILEKMGMKNNAELANYAIRNNLV